MLSIEAGYGSRAADEMNDAGSIASGQQLGGTIRYPTPLEPALCCMPQSLKVMLAVATKRRP
jgi:hypothetical protein